MKPIVGVAIVAILLLGAVVLVQMRNNGGSAEDSDGGETGDENGRRRDELSADYPPDAFTTAGIQLVETTTAGGYDVEYYENRSYTCAKEGYHSFAIISPAGVPRSEERPLWVDMHGGGAGLFNPDGTYEGLTIFYDGENLEELISYGGFKNRAPNDGSLMGMIKADPAGFRFMVPSMCDHDTYGGVGAVDPNNPNNPDENGDTRAVDGLLALRAALDYTVDRVESSHVFARGGSAGSVGAGHLAISLGKDGKRLSGIVMDSGVMTRVYPQVRSCETIKDSTTTAALDRIGMYAEGKHLMHNAIANGVVLTPLYDIWTTGDPVYCGNTQMTVTLDDGREASGGATALVHKLFDEAIDKYNPGGASVWHQVCSGGTACDNHVVTQDDSRVEGDRSRSGEDYNKIVYDWIKARMSGPLPNL